jgi:hypothetical protein
VRVEGVVLGPLRGFIIAIALALPTVATAQLQVDQNFVTQGPFPSFGPTFTVQSGDAPPNGNVGGAVGPVVADPLDANTLFAGTPAGGIWKTTNGGITWTPLTDKQATLSIASLSIDPTDPTAKTLIAGTGLTANGTVCSSGACFFTGSGGLQNGLLYSQDGGNTWTSLGATTLANQTVVGVTARGSVLMAATFEISGLGGDKRAVPQRDRPVSDGLPSETIADHVNSAIGDPTLHASFCAGPALLTFKPKREVPAARPSASRGATRRSPAARWFSRQGDPRAPHPRRTSPPLLQNLIFRYRQPIISPG